MFLNERYAVVSTELTIFHLPERSWTALNGFLPSLTVAGAGTEFIGAECATGDWLGCCTGSARDGVSTLATLFDKSESLYLFINTAAAAITAIANIANASVVR